MNLIEIICIILWLLCCSSPKIWITHWKYISDLKAIWLPKGVNQHEGIVKYSKRWPKNEGAWNVYLQLFNYLLCRVPESILFIQVGHRSHNTFILAKNFCFNWIWHTFLWYWKLHSQITRLTEFLQFPFWMQLEVGKAHDWIQKG